MYRYPRPFLNAGEEPLCERCARRDHGFDAGEIQSSLAILAVVLETLHDSGMSDGEILNACAKSLEERVDVPDIVGFPSWAVHGFENDTRVKRIAS
jgi:hypothetical protein